MPEEKEALAPKKKPRRLPVILLLLVLCAALAAAGVLAAMSSVRVTLSGPEELTLECGDPFADPGAVSTLEGPLRGLLAPESYTSGAVDTARPGSYELEYGASLLWMRDARRRTVRVADTTPPVIELRVAKGTYTIPGQPYVEEGFTASDNVDGDLTAAVIAREADGKVSYTVTDASGNTAQAVRDIFYYDPVPPELELLGEPEIRFAAGKPFVEPGFKAWDNVDGDLTDKVKITGEVDPYRAGTYELTYTVKDSYHHAVSATRRVVVQAVPMVSGVIPGDKIVYLTFDDGPSACTWQLLDILDRYNVKATFFVIGAGNPDLIGEEFRRGHSVGIHSATHRYYEIYANDEAYFNDLNAMAAVVEAQTGQRTSLLRFPGGSSNLVSSNYNYGIMTRLTQAVTDQGYQYFDWNVTSGDAGGTTSTAQVAANIISGIQKQNVSVVLQHDTKQFSVDAVEQVITWGLANGYTFLPLTPTSPTVHHKVAN